METMISSVQETTARGPRTKEKPYAMKKAGIT